MWARLMAICFLTNGLCAFGLRIMTGMGLTGAYKWPYVFLWYWAGFLLAALIILRRRNFANPRELAVGLGLAMSSVGGQVGMASALDHGIPGYIVFQVAPCGGLMFVVLAGIVFFKERVSIYGMCGIILSTAALICLTYA